MTAASAATHSTSAMSSKKLWVTNSVICFTPTFQAPATCGFPTTRSPLGCWTNWYASSVERSTISMTQVYRNCSAEIMLGDSSFHRVRACITKSYMPWVSGECRATVVCYRLYRACEAGDRCRNAGTGQDATRHAEGLTYLGLQTLVTSINRLAAD